MKRNRRFMALASLLAAVLVGCGQTGVQEEVETTTISVDRSGRMTYYLVGEFDKEYYDLSELSAMAADEVERFNRGAEEKQSVVVDKVEVLPENESRVMIVYRFDGYASFNEFNKGSFFYGTVEEAFEQGYVKEVRMKSVRDESLKTEEQLKQEAAKKLIVTDEKVIIYCPAKVAYISEGAVLNEDGSVDASDADGTVYILMK